MSDTIYPMKIRFVCFFLILLTFGCKKDNALTFEPISYSGNTCESCPEIKITVQKALGSAQIDKVINNAIKEELIYLLNFNDELNASDIESAIRSFTKGYTDLKSQFVEEATPWEAAVNAVVSYEDKNIVTIKIDSYLFTGGAHGYNTTHYLNFDKQKTKELNTEDLLKNNSDFEEYAESKFRIQEGIPTEANINSTGFMFETGLFYLPQNIGYTKDGIQLFYEQYEIASYADGPIILTFPYSELQKYLAYAPKPE